MASSRSSLRASLVPACGLLALLGSAAPAFAAATDVTRCGQVTSGDAVLTVDLDCSTYGGTSALTVGGTLRLAGHTLTGNTTLPADGNIKAAIACSGSCLIVGPGAIGGGTDVTINAPSGVAIFDVDVNALDAAVAVYAGSAGARIDRSVISGAFGVGLIAGSSELTESYVVGNGNDGVVGGTVDASASMIAGNGGDGVDATEEISIRDSALSDNGGSGIAGHNVVSLAGTTLTGNGSYAVTGKSVSTEGSTLTGNCVNPGAIVCADIRSCQPPTVASSDCTTSIDCEKNARTRGVCAQD